MRENPIPKSIGASGANTRRAEGDARMMKSHFEPTSERLDLSEGVHLEASPPSYL